MEKIELLTHHGRSGQEYGAPAVQYVASQYAALPQLSNFSVWNSSGPGVTTLELGVSHVEVSIAYK